MELIRVSFNVPKKLAERVENYAKEMGLNKTSGYIVLLNQALTQNDLQKNMPELVNYAKEFEKLATIMKYTQ